MHFNCTNNVMIYLSECDTVSKIFQSTMCTLSTKPISDDGETVICEHVMNVFMYVLELAFLFRTIVWQSVKYRTHGKIFGFLKNEWNKKSKITLVTTFLTFSKCLEL